MRELRQLEQLLIISGNLAKDTRCKKIIRESGLSDELLAGKGEFLFVPLAKRGERNKNSLTHQYRLRYNDEAMVNKAVRKTDVFGYLLLDRIARKGLQAQSYLLCNLWGEIKDKDVGEYAQSIPSLMNLYNRVMFLFNSMVTTGIIPNNSDLMRDAYFLMLWYVIYEIILEKAVLYKETVNKLVQTLLESGGIGEYEVYVNAIKREQKETGSICEHTELWIMLEVLNTSEKDLTYLLTSYYYVQNQNKLWNDLYYETKEKVEAVEEKLKQRAYINTLLSGESNRPRITISSTDTMAPATFEKLIALVFSKLGYNVMTTKLSGDQGVDVIAEKRGLRIAIQAKCYKEPVGNFAIQEVVAGKAFYHAQEAYVVTNSYFTKSAKQLADANNVVLWDRDALNQQMTRMNIYKSDLEYAY